MEFVVVGGISAVLHGAPFVTFDIEPGLTYEDLLPDSGEIRISPAVSVRVLGLRRLIEVKVAAGRKDLASLPTLRATLAEIERGRRG